MSKAPSDIDKLRRIVRLAAADISSRAAPILEFILAAVIAKKSAGEIVGALNANVLPPDGDIDLLPAYVRLGLVRRPRAPYAKIEKIGDSLPSGYLKKFSQKP